MPGFRRSLILESCLLCDSMAPARFPLVRSPDRFGHEKAPLQHRKAPLCGRCLSSLERAGARGVVEPEGGSRWTLAVLAPAVVGPALQSTIAPA